MKPWKSDAKPDQPAPIGNGDLGMVVSMDFRLAMQHHKGA